jgi:hypothetical protein
MSTFKEKFNIKHKQPKNKANSLEDISRLSKIKLSILQKVFDRGIGAWKTNSSSVRSKTGEKRDSGFPISQRMSKERWAIARVYGFVGRNPKQVGKGKPDRDLYEKIKTN